jgi:DNA-binding NarL/FixJ family response regulator
MARVFLAVSQNTERLALRLLLMDLNIEVIGESDDYPTTLAQLPLARTDLLVVDWGLIVDKPVAALQEFREVWPAAMLLVLIDHPDTRQQALISTGGATFLCKDEPPDHFAERLRVISELLPHG